MSESLSPLAKAAMLGVTEDVRRRLELGDSPNLTVTARGLTALMQAAFWNYRDIVQLLLQYGADPNQIYPGDGTTALMRAVIRGHEAVVIMLIEAGADLGIKDYDGNDAFAYAVKNHHTEIKAILQEKDSALSETHDMVEALFGGLNYKDVEVFCQHNFGAQFNKNLLLMVLSKIVFGKPEKRGESDVYTIAVTLHSWEASEKREDDGERLTLEVMDFVGLPDKRCSEIMDNPFRLRKYGEIYLREASSWLNHFSPLGSGAFVLTHSDCSILLTYSIDKKQIGSLQILEFDQL